MKSINRLGLTALLTGALSFGALALPQEGYAEHKGKSKVEIYEEGYSITLIDKTMQNGIKAIFSYNKMRRASLAFLVRDETTGIVTSYAMGKYDFGPTLSAESTEPDEVSITNNNCRKTRPTRDEADMWKSYLKALHQENVREEWYDKHYRRKK